MMEKSSNFVIGRIYSDFYAMKMGDAGYVVFTRVGDCPVYRSADCRVLYLDGRDWKIGKLGSCVKEDKKKLRVISAGEE